MMSFGVFSPFYCHCHDVVYFRALYVMFGKKKNRVRINIFVMLSSYVEASIHAFCLYFFFFFFYLLCLGLSA